MKVENNKVGKQMSDHATTTSELREMLTVDEAAEFLRINRNTLYEDIKAGNFPARKFGRRGIIRISRDAMLAWLNDAAVAEGG